MPRSRAEIRDLLTAHMAADGTMNDSQVGEWYREWYRLESDVEIELETQEQWAFDVVQGKYNKQLTGRPSAPTVA